MPREMREDARCEAAPAPMRVPSAEKMKELRRRARRRASCADDER